MRGKTNVKMNGSQACPVYAKIHIIIYNSFIYIVICISSMLIEVSFQNVETNFKRRKL